jgi:hypothetical protein
MLAVAAAAAALCGSAPAGAEAQSSGPSAGVWQARISRILVDSAAVRPVFRRLWDESVDTGREQVACIGGERRGREVRISRAAELREVVRSAGAAADIDSDSVSVSREGSRLSVEACGPPDWIGTVHTHRIEDGVEHPGLSSDDRAVVSLWHARWRRESVFCVLYSPEKPPYCEHRS